MKNTNWQADHTQWKTTQRKVRGTNRTETWWTCRHCGQRGCNDQWVKDHTGHCDDDKSWKRKEQIAAEICKGRPWC